MFSSGFHESCVVEPSSLPPSPIRGNGGGGAFADLLDDEDEDVVDSEEDDEDFDEDDDSDFEGETEDGAESEESEEDDVSVGAATADSHQTPEAAAHSVAPSVVSSSDEGSEGEEEGEGEGEGEQEESGAGGDGDKVVVKTVKKEPRRSGAPGRRRRTQSDLGAGSHEPFVDAPSAPASPSRAGYKVRDASTETEADEEAPIVAPLVEVAKKAGAKGKTGEKAKIRRPMFEVVVTDAACVLPLPSPALPSLIPCASQVHLLPRPHLLPLHRLDHVRSPRLDVPRRARPRRPARCRLPLHLAPRLPLWQHPSRRPTGHDDARRCPRPV